VPQSTSNERHVLAQHGVLPELLLQSLDGAGMLGEDQHARRATIEPVDGDRPAAPPLTGDSLGEQVEQGIGFVGVGGDRQHAGGLVDDQNVGVLMDQAILRTRAFRGRGVIAAMRIVLDANDVAGDDGFPG
jgi:hypothetical protein